MSKIVFLKIFYKFSLFFTAEAVFNLTNKKQTKFLSVDPLMFCQASQGNLKWLSQCLTPEIAY